jgi:hypothetical protein
MSAAIDPALNLALRDGRVITMFGPHPAHDRKSGGDGARTLDAGPMSFELVEPLRYWHASVEGQ